MRISSPGIIVKLLLNRVDISGRHRYTYSSTKEVPDLRNWGKGSVFVISAAAAAASVLWIAARGATPVSAAGQDISGRIGQT